MKTAAERNLTLVALSLLSLAIAGRGESVTSESETPKDQCKLYLAPSTIPNAGLGVFTAVPLHDGEIIGHGDVLIPIVDVDLSMNGRFTWMVGDYIWDGESCGIAHESVRPRGVTGLGPGLDGAINCHLALINVDSTLSQRDGAGLHRSRNPGAGAFSEYYNSTTFAKTKIPAGGELFKFYGDHWFQGRPEKFGLIPLTEDYVKANELIWRFHSSFMTQERLSAKSKRTLYDLVRNLPIEARMLNALPSYDDIAEAAENGIESLNQAGAMRSLQMLESTGRCLDNSRPGLSSFREAGRGAFATKHLPGGSVITGSPLIHIAYEETLVMHDFEWKKGKHDYQMNTSRFSGYQLLLNYCWGHEASTVLLCPYGAGINFINHNQSLANVAIQWAPDGQMSHNSTWLQNIPVNEMENEFSTKVALDFVALRDIELGEELFLDYGDAWEEAWSNHVQQWEQESAFHTEYLSSAQYNLEYERSAIRTIEEQRRNPYPENLVLRCHQEANSFTVSLHSKIEWTLEDTGFECDILERIPNGDDFVYHVTIRDAEGNAKNISGLSRDFFAFFDRPYTTDMHLSWAFRHKMILPDAMFPQVWRNKRRHGDP